MIVSVHYNQSSSTTQFDRAVANKSHLTPKAKRREMRPRAREVSLWRSRLLVAEQWLLPNLVLCDSHTQSFTLFAVI